MLCTLIRCKKNLEETTQLTANACFDLKVFGGTYCSLYTRLKHVMDLVPFEGGFRLPLEYSCDNPLVLDYSQIKTDGDSIEYKEVFICAGFLWNMERSWE